MWPFDGSESCTALGAQITMTTTDGSPLQVDSVSPVAGLDLSPLSFRVLEYADAGGIFIRETPAVSPTNPTVPTGEKSDWQCLGLTPQATSICVL